MNVHHSRRLLAIGAGLVGVVFMAAPASSRDVSAQAGAHPYRVFAPQVASTPTPTGARCNDHTFAQYTGASTCFGHGGVHYYIYPGND